MSCLCGADEKVCGGTYQSIGRKCTTSRNREFVLYHISCPKCGTVKVTEERHVIPKNVKRWQGKRCEEVVCARSGRHTYTCPNYP